jgi:hypothetical protein
LDIGERLSNYWQYIGPMVGRNQPIFAPTAGFGQTFRWSPLSGDILTIVDLSSLSALKSRRN